MRESHRRIQERFPRRPLELPPLFGQRPPPAAACLRLQFGQSVSSSATAASVALDTNRNSARPALQNRRSHSSNCALHPGSSRHGLALASPVRQTRAGPQYQLAAACVANPLVSHVKGGACSKDCLPPSPCSTSSSLPSFNASRDDSKAKKPKIPTAERQNFNCRELSRLDQCEAGVGVQGHIRDNAVSKSRIRRRRNHRRVVRRKRPAREKYFDPDSLRALFKPRPQLAVRRHS